MIRFDTAEDEADAQMAHHNRAISVAVAAGYDAEYRDYYCDCDDRSCPMTHDDCACPAECERHGTGLCMRCERIRPLDSLVELEAHESWCPACFVADYLKLTAAGDDWDVSAFRETLAAHGVWMPTTEAATVSLAAE